MRGRRHARRGAAGCTALAVRPQRRGGLGTDPGLLRLLPVCTGEALVSAAKVLVRELAGWGFDEDRYRPAVYRGNPDHARAAAAGRAPFKARTAMLELAGHPLKELLQEQEGRADLREEMKGLDWSLGLVDLQRLLAFQRRILLDP